MERRQLLSATVGILALSPLDVDKEDSDRPGVEGEDAGVEAASDEPAPGDTVRIDVVLREE